MIQTKIIQSNNEISLEAELNNELLELQKNKNKIMDIHYQQSTLFNGNSMRPLYSVMIIYKESEEDNV